MHNIIEIDFQGGSMKILNTAIEGIISNDKDLTITLLGATGGVVTFTVSNIEDFKKIEQKWVDVVGERTVRLNKEYEDHKRKREEYENRSKASLIVQAKMAESAINHMGGYYAMA